MDPPSCSPARAQVADLRRLKPCCSPVTCVPGGSRLQPLHAMLQASRRAAALQWPRRGSVLFLSIHLLLQVLCSNFLVLALVVLLPFHVGRAYVALFSYLFLSPTSSISLVPFYSALIGPPAPLTATTDSMFTASHPIDFSTTCPLPPSFLMLSRQVSHPVCLPGTSDPLLAARLASAADNRTAGEGSRLRKRRRKQQRQQRWEEGGVNGSRQRQVMSWQQQGQQRRGLLDQLVSGPLSVFNHKRGHTSKRSRQSGRPSGQDGCAGDEPGTAGGEEDGKVRKSGEEKVESRVEPAKEAGGQEERGHMAAGEQEQQEAVHSIDEGGNASDHKANNQTGERAGAFDAWLTGASEIVETLQLVTAQLGGFVLMVCRAACTAMGLQWAAGGDGLASGDIVCLLVGYEMLLLLAGAVMVVVVKVARSRGMSLLGLLPSTLLALVYLAPVIEEHVMASLR